MTHQVHAARRFVIEMTSRADHGDHVADHRGEVVCRRHAGFTMTPQVERDHLEPRIVREQPLDHRVERGGGLGDPVHEHDGRS